MLKKKKPEQGATWQYYQGVLIANLQILNYLIWPLKWHQQFNAYVFSILVIVFTSTLNLPLNIIGEWKLENTVKAEINHIWTPQAENTI